MMMRKFLSISLFLLIAIDAFSQLVGVEKESIGFYQGKEIFLFTLKNEEGNVIKINSFGAKITWIEIPDRNGVKENITLGYPTLRETIEGDNSFGSVMGRFANRIANGRFSLDGVEYTLPKNGGRYFVNGGRNGWHSVVWDAEIPENTKSPSIKLTYINPDMEEGFPGTVHAQIVYTWTDKNEILIEYTCITDKNTVLNVTNHAYFNLHGAGNGDILDHVLTIQASAFTPVDSITIPTGEIRPVIGTPFDFTEPHTIGERINDDYDQLRWGRGYDINYVLDNKDEVDAAVYDPISGRKLEVITDQPGLVFYTGNFLNKNRIGYDGKSYIFRSGLCLESDHYPDSPNHPEFPTTTLNAGDIFKSTTIYRFSVVNQQ
jgi:aldose 1-epimerase